MLDTVICAINTPKRRPARPFQSSKCIHMYLVDTCKVGSGALSTRDFGALPTLKSLEK